MQTVLITVDALRADHLGQYGYDRDTMPVLDRLRSGEGTLFSSAFSNGPYTRVSVPSFHTSRRLAYDRIEDLPTIASTLEAEGVRTACIGTQTGFENAVGALHFGEYDDLGRDEYHEQAVSGRPLHQRLVDPVHEMARSYGPAIRDRFPRLFDVSKDVYDAVVPGSGVEVLGYTSAREVTDSAIEWIQAHADEDFFLWLHYMEGHRPYGVHDPDPAYTDPAPAAEIKSTMERAGMHPDEVPVRDHRRMVDLYDSDLRYCSGHLDRLFDAMEASGVWTETNVVFTSDHGEEFYDHGYYFHRNLPYDELLHVPLLVKTPGAVDRIDEQRELLDLAPTVCDWHGVDAPDSFEGEPLYEGDARDVVAIGAQQHTVPVVAGRWDDWKYVSVGEEELLYDLADDPREERSVADEHPEVCDSFRASIPDWLFDRSLERLRDPSDEVDRERLAALGYLEVGDE